MSIPPNLITRLFKSAALKAVRAAAKASLEGANTVIASAVNRAFAISASVTAASKVVRPALVAASTTEGFGVSGVSTPLIVCMMPLEASMSNGVTFKENCPDVRNTKAVDVINNLKSYGSNVLIYDPWAEPEEVKHEYGLETTNQLPSPNDKFDAVVLAVAHKEFLALDLREMLKPNGVLYDVKGILKCQVDGRL